MRPRLLTGRSESHARRQLAEGFRNRASAAADRDLCRPLPRIGRPAPSARDAWPRDAAECMWLSACAVLHRELSARSAALSLCAIHGLLL